MLSEYEIQILQARLSKLYSHSMKPFYEESRYDCFIDSETFEKNKQKIWELNGGR